MLSSPPYPSPLNDDRIEASIRRFGHGPSAGCSNIFLLKVSLNNRREPNQPCPDHCEQYHRRSKIDPGSRRRTYDRDGRSRRFILSHDPNSRHCRFPLSVDCNTCLSPMNLTRDDTVWIGFFKLSQARMFREDPSDHSGQDIVTQRRSAYVLREPALCQFRSQQATLAWPLHRLEAK